jgi:hypothetical protein
VDYHHLLGARNIKNVSRAREGAVLCDELGLGKYSSASDDVEVEEGD